MTKEQKLELRQDLINDLQFAAETIANYKEGLENAINRDFTASTLQDLQALIDLEEQVFTNVRQKLKQLRKGQV